MLADGLEELVHDNWREIALDHDRVPLAPDWDEYAELERKGRHKFVAMRDGGVLVGYNAFFLNKALNYRHTLFGVNNVIWLHPDYRHGFSGVRFLRESERLLWDEGVVKLIYHIKVHVLLGARRSGNMGDILLRLGYRHIEECYSKTRPGE